MLKDADSANNAYDGHYVAGMRRSYYNRQISLKPDRKQIATLIRLSVSTSPHRNCQSSPQHNTAYSITLTAQLTYLYIIRKVSFWFWLKFIHIQRKRWSKLIFNKHYCPLLLITLVSWRFWNVSETTVGVSFTSYWLLTLLLFFHVLYLPYGRVLCSVTSPGKWDAFFPCVPSQAPQSSQNLHIWFSLCTLTLNITFFLTPQGTVSYTGSYSSSHRMFIH